MTIPQDYAERVYAGVLGKLIGVYLGRPFEGATYERIMETLGEINYYVHEQRKVPLIVTDDDISGTFTFLRALEDYGATPDITPAQVGQTWLNYIIEKQSILWWGGLGNSTEHTAFLRLKQGIPAPQSGSIALNGKIVAEQIGAQIFIDGWGMVAPGDPELAAALAHKAGSVSHDGEALYGAQVIAAMEAVAFVESDIAKLIDVAVSFIPKDSVIYRMIADLREWHAQYPDWRMTREKIAAHYGYDKYGGNCHMVPNHALIHLGLLYSEDSFQRALMITNTSGWDTDCNSGNIGCLMGIKVGLAGIEAGPDWRGPVADRLLLPTADGGRAVTDSVSVSTRITNLGRQLNGQPPVIYKQGARFHFEMPGSVQGFQVEDSPEARGALTLENLAGHSQSGSRCLALHYHHLAPGRSARAATATFITPAQLTMPGYHLHGSPTLYPGQTIRASISADSHNNLPVEVSLYLQVYNPDDLLTRIMGPSITLAPGEFQKLEWQITGLIGQPVVEVGLQITSDQPAQGTLYLDYLTWDGAPEAIFTRPSGSKLERPGPQLWRRAWVNALNQWEARFPEPYRLIQNEGRGMLIQGTRDWGDYRVSAEIKPILLKTGGIAIRVQGLRRYYALLLCQDGRACLVKALDGEVILAELPFNWQTWQSYRLSLQAVGSRLIGWVDDQLLFDVTDSDLSCGGIAFVVEEGHLTSEAVQVSPATFLTR